MNIKQYISWKFLCLVPRFHKLCLGSARVKLLVPIALFCDDRLRKLEERALGSFAIDQRIQYAPHFASRKNNDFRKRSSTGQHLEKATLHLHKAGFVLKKTEAGLMIVPATKLQWNQSSSSWKSWQYQPRRSSLRFPRSETAD